jgi:hypothetical protein
MCFVYSRRPESDTSNLYRPNPPIFDVAPADRTLTGHDQHVGEPTWSVRSG